MTTPALAHCSCLLFVPGNRPDLFEKARNASPEGVVLDLEDAVPVAEKHAARAAVICFLQQHSVGPSIYVRLNAASTRAGLDDLVALTDGQLVAEGLVLPKVESARDVSLIRQLDQQAGRSLLVALESAAGIESATVIASAMAEGDGLVFGGADLAADLGAAFAWEPLLTSRCAVVRAGATRGLPAFDVPFLALDAPDALADETRRVRDLGFGGKLAIHPAQVAPIRAAFRPEAAELASARTIVHALENSGGGAAIVNGRMVDAPVARSAARTLARAAQR